MSVREEEKRKSKSSPSLGLAAAAIGVGVGAALYYFLSKRPENPDTEGSTSEGWNEQPQTLMDCDSDEYTTVSETSTTDTSIIDPIGCCCGECELCTDESDYSDADDESDSDSSESEDWSPSDESMVNVFDHSLASLSGDSNEWDVTNSSIGIPDLSITNSPLAPMFNFLESMSSLLETPLRSFRGSNGTEQRQPITVRDSKAFRKRAWSLEQCSICFEVMLGEQQLMSLPCTHNFHIKCIAPWLEQQQTCPVCRKPVE